MRSPHWRGIRRKAPGKFRMLAGQVGNSVFPLLPAPSLGLPQAGQAGSSAETARKVCRADSNSAASACRRSRSLLILAIVTALIIKARKWIELFQ